MKTPPRSSRSNLEKASIWHAAIYVFAAAWMFGGKIDWARPPLQIWGMIGMALTVLGFIDRRQRGLPVLRWFYWILPALLMALWVLLGSFNPNLEVIWFYEQQVYRPIEPIGWLPSAAVPTLARSELLLMFGLFTSGFNLALNVNHRHSLRQLTLMLGLNAGLLAIFGTIQKLLRTDIFLGLQTSPNSAFFASFIYHNHWGPFALLNIAGWFGLVEYLQRRNQGRGFFNSPAMLALLAILLIAVAIPLSTSRSSTAMLALLVPGCGFWLLWRSSRSVASASARRWMLGAGVATVLSCAGAAFWLGGETIRHRIDDTRTQLAAMKEMGGLGQRGRLYQDTWTIIESRPVTGWGLESYATIYRRFTTEPKTVEGWTVQFNEAHSDWLQLLAETGFVGLSLLLLALGIPLWSLRHRLFREPYAGSIFICLSLLALFAWVEFPFANPAVTLSAWVAFYSAIRYLQLEQSKVRAHSRFQS